MQLSFPLLPREAIAHAVLHGVIAECPWRSLAHANLPARHERELVPVEAGPWHSGPPLALHSPIRGAPEPLCNLIPLDLPCALVT